MTRPKDLVLQALTATFVAASVLVSWINDNSLGEKLQVSEGVTIGELLGYTLRKLVGVKLEEVLGQRVEALGDALISIDDNLLGDCSGCRTMACLGCWRKVKVEMDSLVANGGMLGVSDED